MNRFEARIADLFQRTRSLLGLLGVLFCLNFLGTISRSSAQLSAQETKREGVAESSIEAVPRASFFSTDSLEEKERILSEELLMKALDSEALYTLAGQLKPVAEGFWSGYFDLDAPELTEIDRVRTALRAWHVPGLFFADVLVYESSPKGQRYAAAYVVHLPSFKQVIAREGHFFARWGITSETPPHEVMLAVERTRQPEDRWRAFGLLFGYPEFAVDFFVAAGLHQRTTGEFVERDFRQIASFASRTGRFVYAVPKLSRLRTEEIELQRRAAVLLTEYKRLRPKYATPQVRASELLRHWMDDGHARCHPKNLMAKLPSMTPEEIDAEVASWSASEARPPEVKFNHLYLVLNRETFESIRNSDFVKDKFAAADQGFPRYHPITSSCQAIYLRGRDTYLELLGPENAFGEPVGKVGVGWSVEKVGALDRVAELLSKEMPNGFTRVLKMWDFEREGAVPWYHSLFHSQPTSGHAFWWYSETHTDFLPSLLPEKAQGSIDISRRAFLEHRYDANRVLRNVTSLTWELPSNSARLLRTELERLGWRTDEFDARTWILKGPDFRLMLLVQADTSMAALKSIGFDVNPGILSPQTVPLGAQVEWEWDGNQSGWFRFK